MNARRAKRLRREAERRSAGEKPLSANVFYTELTMKDGTKQSVVKAVQAVYEAGSFGRIYRDMKRGG